MKLSEIFMSLADSEVSNLGFVENGAILPESLPKILRAINLGLADLHTRFLLRKKRIAVDLVPDQLQYTIAEPDFVELLTTSLPNIDKSLLSPNTFYASVDAPTTITVEYKATLPPLTEADIAADSNVELPIAYLNALLYFIGSRMLMSIPNQMDGDINEGTRYTQKYMEELAMLTQQGVDVDGVYENNWFNERGFR